MNATLGASSDVSSHLMMMHPSVLLFVILSVWSVSAQQACYVLPNGSSPLSCPGSPCLTIDQYTQQQTETYFTTGSTFIFLAGNHSLESTLTLTNISDVTLRGEGNASQVNIVFRENVSIHCDRVKNLTIEELTFLLHSNKKLTIENLTILLAFNKIKNMAGVLNFSSSDEINISFSIFQGNGLTPARALSLRSSNIEIAGCVFNGSIGDGGGAISATGDSNITLIGSVLLQIKHLLVVPFMH